MRGLGLRAGLHSQLEWQRNARDNRCGATTGTGLGSGIWRSDSSSCIPISCGWKHPALPEDLVERADDETMLFHPVEALPEGFVTPPIYWACVDRMVVLDSESE